MPLAPADQYESTIVRPACVELCRPDKYELGAIDHPWGGPREVTIAVGHPEIAFANGPESCDSFLFQQGTGMFEIGL